MSLPVEALSTDAFNPLATAGRMYRQYASEELKCQKPPSTEIAENPFYQVSVKLADMWKQAPRYANDPEDAAAQADLMEWAEDNLPDKTAHDSYLWGVLRAGQLLVSERQDAPSPELETDIEDLAIDRALRLREVLTRPLSEKLTHYLQQQKAGACATAVLNLENFAMPPMVHQIVDSRNNMLDGVLLERKRRVISPFWRYSVSYGCAGFTEGHRPDGQAAILSMRFKRVRVLSACCDLRLMENTRDGRTDLDDIIDILDDNRHGLATHGDVAHVSQLGDKLADTIAFDESRRGTRLTKRQADKARSKARAQLHSQQMA